MTQLRFEGKNYSCSSSESVLECLTRHGVPVPSSCKSGICQTCLMRVVVGQVPAAAQKELKPTLIAQGYFLACVCHPDDDIEVALATAEAQSRFTARVVAKRSLNAEIVEIALQADADLEYRPGQFINVINSAGLSRSYSLASVPELDGNLALHVRKLTGGRLSTWLHDTLQPGDCLEMSGPLGHCFYAEGQPTQPLLLVATGSGLAPLWGIVRDALGRGHTGPIHLFHGSHSVAGLYLIDELKALAQQHDKFHYYPCVSDGSAPPGFFAGRADAVALNQFPQLKGWRVYLCGHPDMVTQLKRQAFLKGAALNDILADPFITSA